MSRNKVFISYPTEDGVIADAVSTAIAKMPENGLGVFLDREYIKGGARIPDTIRDALKETVYFVAIGTDVKRRNFDWCGQELGFYQASHLDDDRLETCLYDKAIPQLFVERRSYKAQSLKNEHLDEFGYPIVEANQSEFYNFLMDIANLNAELHPPAKAESYWHDIPPWAEQYTRLVSDSFFTALLSRVKDKWYPQGRLMLRVDKGDFYKEPNSSIPLDAHVSLEPSAYKIFKAAPPSTLRPVSWDVFVNWIREKTGSDVLARMVSDIVVTALPDRDEAKNDYVFQGPNEKFYRVLLVKHSVYGNKRRDLAINLVETLEKVKGGDANTTTLVAAIVLASKYRSIFIEKGARYDDARLRSLTLVGLQDEIYQMLHDIDRISADAASDGFADYSVLETLLGNSTQVKRLFQTWWEVFPPMETAAKKLIEDPNAENQESFFTAYGKFLSVSRNNNGTFLRLCLDEFSKHIT